MAILNVTTITPGLVGAGPSIIYINTSDTLQQVTAAGYLNAIVNTGTNLSNSQVALVYTIDQGSVMFNISAQNGLYSLTLPESSSTQVVTDSTVQMSSNQRYISRKSGGTQTFLLPTNPAIGDMVYVFGSRTCSWVIPTGAPKYIVQGENFFNTQCTSGTSNGNCIELICVDTGGGWNVVTSPPVPFAS